MPRSCSLAPDNVEIFSGDEDFLLTAREAGDDVPRSQEVAPGPVTGVEVLCERTRTTHERKK